MIPVRTETLEKSTALKISIFSENSFCILLIKLLSVILKDIFYYTKDMQGLTVFTGTQLSLYKMLENMEAYH